jgi:predicted XRE-type DNA-binding protein
MSKSKVSAKAKTTRKAQRFENVWDAIADTPAEAANLRLRSELMDAIAAVIKKNGWTQVQTAEHCGITQPRVNDLLRGRISRFSLDALVNIAASLGRRVHVALKAA